MPLGAVAESPYEVKNIQLDIGDTVLVMTDGLPELFNIDKDSFGYERIRNVFIQNISEPVNEIVNKLFVAGEDWLNGAKQNDDITIVAFRLNDKKGST